MILARQLWPYIAEKHSESPYSLIVKNNLRGSSLRNITDAKPAILNYAPVVNI